MFVRMIHWGYPSGERNWGNVRTDWVFDIDTVPDFRNSPENALQLFNFHRHFQLSEYNTKMITCLPAAPAGIEEQAKTGWTFTFKRFGRGGLKPTNGEFYFKDKLRFTKYPYAGRVTHQMLSGCLDETDVLRSLDGSAYYKPTAGDIEYMHTVNNVAGSIFKRTTNFRTTVLGTVALGDWTRAKSIGIGGISQLHANTRWRREIKGETVSMGAKLVGTLELMANQFEDNQAFLDEIPEERPDVWYQPTVGLLFGISQRASDIDQWIENNKWEDGTEPEEPRGRFGPTSALILDKWKSLGDIFQQQLPELQKVYKPHQGPEGFTWIEKKNLQPYQDMLEEAIRTLSFSVSFDWYNPYSYPNQEPEDGYEFPPDIVALKL